MKFILLFVTCLLLASTGLAAPNVTEIRLEDAPGTLKPPILRNEFVFRSDGNFYWTEGTLEKPVRHRYAIGTQAFQTLAATLGTHHFFDLKPLYDRSKPGDPLIMNGSTVVVSVMRDGLRRTVVDYAGFGPSNLWELEMILRGFASRHIGLKRTPMNTSFARPIPAPTTTPIPVIRGTKKAPN
ncbi:hypothetical protein IAD21_04078 [Abditibacteriota bacterium]|nr:hypothetical protein IAD21_04078 [Abditibacteriota bacterium]